MSFPAHTHLCFVVFFAMNNIARFNVFLCANSNGLELSAIVIHSLESINMSLTRVLPLLQI